MYPQIVPALQCDAQRVLCPAGAGQPLPHRQIGSGVLQAFPRPTEPFVDGRAVGRRHQGTSEAYTASCMMCIGVKRCAHAAREVGLLNAPWIAVLLNVKCISRRGAYWLRVGAPNCWGLGVRYSEL